MSLPSVAAALRHALLLVEPAAKVAAARALRRDWRGGRLAFRFDVTIPDAPARPAAPMLLPPGRMPKRGRAQSERGRIALYHALAHIEFVAIDLALDMAGRFGADQPRDFTSDFIDVAAEEAMHFALLDRRLRTLGSGYGALPAHDGLWRSAATTRHDVAARLAVVPLALEARGLDVTPRMIEQLERAGDERGARLLTRILADEIRHVAIGVRHFERIAKGSRKSAPALWQTLIADYFAGNINGPFNRSAREAAGLSWCPGDTLVS